MLRFSAGLLCTVLFSSAALSQAYHIRDDADLKSPVTLSIKYGPIQEVLKTLSKQMNVQVRAATSISDLKVTLFVKDVPGNIILDRIGEALDCEWKNDGGNRILVMTQEESKSISKFLSAEDDVLKKKAEDELAHMLDKDSGQDQTANTENVPAQRFHRGLPGPSNQTIVAAVTKMFSEASSSDMDSFWNGEIFHYEVAPQESGPASPIPGRRHPGLAGVTRHATVVYARYDNLGSHELQLGSSQSPIPPLRFIVPATDILSGSLAESTYGKKLLSWDLLTPDAHEDAFAKDLPHPENAVGFTIKKTAPGDNSDLGGIVRTQSDLLEKFATDSGLSVVADGFRTTLPGQRLDPRGANPVEWLKGYTSNFGAFVQIKDGIVTVRQGGFWRLRQYEVSEDVLRPMEKNPKTLTLDDYAKFFYGLTPAQAKSFESSNPPEVAFPIDSIANQIPTLRVLGSLPSNFPTDGRHIPMAELGDETQSLIWQAVAESAFSGDAWQNSTPQDEKIPSFMSLIQSNVSQPEGTVSGVSVQYGLPIGQVVNVPIPLKLVF